MIRRRHVHNALIGRNKTAFYWLSGARTTTTEYTTATPQTKDVVKVLTKVDQDREGMNLTGPSAPHLLSAENENGG